VSFADFPYDNERRRKKSSFTYKVNTSLRIKISKIDLLRFVRISHLESKVRNQSLGNRAHKTMRKYLSFQRDSRQPQQEPHYGIAKVCFPERFTRIERQM
jgi:hypothetical protein